MVTVAIAGGGSSIASNIIPAILAAKKHQLVILSRSPRPDLEKQGAIIKVVDYSSREQLTKALDGVHTVISCIWSYGPELAGSQITLLEAAKEANVKRFVPSDWGIPAYDKISTYKPKAAVWEAVQASGLEYTRFIPGLWMNVWAVGAPRDEAGGRSGYEGPAFLVDIQGGSILIPGDGSCKLVVTDMKDIGKYVAAALDFETWDGDSLIVGERLSVNELVDKIEKVTGKALDKSYISLEGIDAVLAGDADALTKVIHEFLRIIGEGLYDFEPNVNQQAPEVKPTTVDEFLAKHWSTSKGIELHADIDLYGHLRGAAAPTGTHAPRAGGSVKGGAEDGGLEDEARDEALAEESSGEVQGDEGNDLGAGGDGAAHPEADGRDGRVDVGALAEDDARSVGEAGLGPDGGRGRGAEARDGRVGHDGELRADVDDAGDGESRQGDAGDGDGGGDWRRDGSARREADLDRRAKVVLGGDGGLEAVGQRERDVGVQGAPGLAVGARDAEVDAADGGAVDGAREVVAHVDADVLAHGSGAVPGGGGGGGAGDVDAGVLGEVPPPRLGGGHQGRVRRGVVGDGLDGEGLAAAVAGAGVALGHAAWAARRSLALANFIVMSSVVQSTDSTAPWKWRALSRRKLLDALRVKFAKMPGGRAATVRDFTAKSLLLLLLLLLL
ncbi:nad-p-binding [Trichoderma cornu-damae]|uniref:Nad-p-binding n=1 Tax=Trichoderma cornu-damae TaxID=654480 RepID=A0A9P8QML0_9HYPO|nr:nad-p-binding [Trichoderma cornu-damae]